MRKTRAMTIGKEAVARFPAPRPAAARAA